MRKREQALMPGGVPKKLRIYDNGFTVDRYTIVFSGRAPNKTKFSTPYLSTSSNPTSPNGVASFGEWDHGRDVYKHDDGTWQHSIDAPRYSHLGKKITWNKLPASVQEYVKMTYRELWDLPQGRTLLGAPRSLLGSRATQGLGSILDRVLGSAKPQKKPKRAPRSPKSPKPPKQQRQGRLPLLQRNRK
jgi:hypothetical protein